MFSYYVNFNFQFDATFLCESQNIPKKFMRFNFGAEHNVQLLWVIYLQTIFRHDFGALLNHKVMYNLSLFTYRHKL